VAYVTNNKRLCSTFCTIEANYWQIRSIARPLCYSRATCFIFAWLYAMIVLSTNLQFWQTISSNTISVQSPIQLTGKAFVRI